MEPPKPFLIGVIIIAAVSQYILSYHLHRSPPTSWNFVLMSDQDLDSRDPVQLLWTSILQHGTLTKNETSNTFSIEWGNTSFIGTSFAYQNRSMEISALEYYNGKLLAFCDRSGVVFDINLVNETASINSFIHSGDGKQDKPFKSEWATAKDGKVYIGSIGKEWTHEGKTLHEDLFWIKQLSKEGTLTHIDWKNIYQKIRQAANATFPGYLIHEAVVWDSEKNQWLFLPRKLSTSTAYDEKTDELLGSNVLFLASEDGSKVSHVTIGPLEKEWGFSEIKVLPPALQHKGKDKPTILMGVKVKEVNGLTQSKIAVFDTQGTFYTEPQFLPIGGARTLANRRPVSNIKFEALAFLPTKN